MSKVEVDRCSPVHTGSQRGSSGLGGEQKTEAPPQAGGRTCLEPGKGDCEIRALQEALPARQDLAALPTRQDIEALILRVEEAHRLDLELVRADVATLSERMKGGMR